MKLEKIKTFHLEALTGRTVTIRKWYDNEYWLLTALDNDTAELFVLDEGGRPGGPSMTDWISVKDRLPEQFTSVLVYSDSVASDIAVGSCQILSTGTVVWFPEGVDGGDCLLTMDDEVTHWQPLPPPPEEE